MKQQKRTGFVYVSQKEPYFCKDSTSRAKKILYFFFAKILFKSILSDEVTAVN